MFNADDYKNVNREQWQATAQAWHDWMPHVTRWLREATDTMLDMADVGPGDRVLDLAAGDGDQSLAAATRVGPTGYVLATDIAPNFVALAEQVAKDARVSQLEARLMDAE
ncbi:MAG: methyltransferase domain-containing protein, partial [Nitrosomonadaceae bacterium]